MMLPWLPPKGNPEFQIVFKSKQPPVDLSQVAVFYVEFFKSQSGNGFDGWWLQSQVLIGFGGQHPPPGSPFD